MDRRFLAIQRWAYPLLCDATQRFSVALRCYAEQLLAFPL